MTNKMITETYKVYGELVTHFGTFKLLSEHPNMHGLHFSMREQGFVEWYVVDSTGTAMNIILKGDALVKPYFEPVEMEVKLILEDG